MKTTKILSFILAAALCLGVLGGCSSEAPAETTQVPATKPTATEPSATESPVTTEETKTPAETGAQVPAVDLPHSDKFTVKDGAVTFTDMLDREVTIPQNPKRVIVLDYNNLDLWYYAGGTAVGRTDHILVQSRADESDIGKAIREVEVINGAHDPVNIEMIVDKEPDLIIISPREKTQLEAVEAFEQYKIPYFAWSYDSFDGFIENLELFTLLTNREDLYERYAMDNITRRNAVLEKIKDHDPVTMVMLLPHSTQGIYALASSGYLGNLCNDMKLDNIAGVTSSTNISVESLVEIDPEWILSRGGSGKGTEETAREIYEAFPLWFELTAVKEGRYKHLPGELFLYHANTRYADAYEYLGKLIYPDLFR